MSDRQRLVRRTQLKRSTYHVLGKRKRSEEEEKEEEAEEEEEGVDGLEEGARNAHLRDYDEEIFDDDDFYQQVRVVIKCEAVSRFSWRCVNTVFARIHATAFIFSIPLADATFYLTHTYLSSWVLLYCCRCHTNLLLESHIVSSPASLVSLVPELELIFCFNGGYPRA